MLTLWQSRREALDRATDDDGTEDDFRVLDPFNVYAKEDNDD